MGEMHDAIDAYNAANDDGASAKLTATEEDQLWNELMNV